MKPELRKVLIRPVHFSYHRPGGWLPVHQAGLLPIPGRDATHQLVLQLLYAEQKHRVLIVLQGLDTADKDGTIRHIFEGVNPQGGRVASYKKPTPSSPVG